MLDYIFSLAVRVSCIQRGTKSSLLKEIPLSVIMDHPVSQTMHSLECKFQHYLIANRERAIPYESGEALRCPVCRKPHVEPTEGYPVARLAYQNNENVRALTGSAPPVFEADDTDDGNA